jgi:hypothetical protein
LDDVASCQIYVGIFGWRYGFVPPEGNADCRSITELEYRRSRELGRETLVFLQRMESARPQFMDAVLRVNDSGALIERLRAELATSAGIIKEFSTAEELRGHVLAAVALAADRLPAAQASELKQALCDLKQIAILILKLWLFKKTYEDLLVVYLNTPALRSEAAEALTAADVRDAARTARRQLIPAAAVLDEWDRYLSGSERRVMREFFAELDRSIARLEQLGSAEAAPGAPVGESGIEIVDDFNKSLVTLLNHLDGDADGLWQAIRLGQLHELLQRVQAGKPGDYIERAEEGYRELSSIPPLHARCDILVREHDLLDDALETFAILRKEVGQLDLGAVRMYCSTIDSQVDEARVQWRAFLSIEREKKEAWEDDLLRLGQHQWKYIDQCQTAASAALNELDDNRTELPPGLLDRLRALRKALEFHFQYVDKALAGAYGRMKSTVGDPLLSALAMEDAHAQ